MEVNGSTVVITGASSGIGRATAIKLAGRGARLVLVARREQVLEDAARACRDAGGEAIAIAADVRDAEAMHHVAKTAIEHQGGIDAWFNNAGVYVLGRFEDIPEDVFRGVVETDFFGVVNGTRAVIGHFLERRRGLLINTSSMVGAQAAPFMSAYAAAKWAVRGFTQSVREEMIGRPDIHVCAVLPASIDTPIFQHAANYSGRPVKALPPVYDVDKVADAVVDLFENPKREIVVGAAARATMVQGTLAPGLTERMLRLQVDRTHFGAGHEAPTPGAVLDPVDEGDDVSGGWLRGGGDRFGRSEAAAESRRRAAAAARD